MRAIPPAITPGALAPAAAAAGRRGPVAMRFDVQVIARVRTSGVKALGAQAGDDTADGFCCLLSITCCLGKGMPESEDE